jgi:hypothetical protein
LKGRIMDTNKSILIAAPMWLNAALEEHVGEPEGMEEDDSRTEDDRLDIPLGFL